MTLFYFVILVRNEKGNNSNDSLSVNAENNRTRDAEGGKKNCQQRKMIDDVPVAVCQVTINQLKYVIKFEQKLIKGCKHTLVMLINEENEADHIKISLEF